MPQSSSEAKPVQHTPKHLEGDSEVFDQRHPAASAFAVAQPAAGVVANDVEERGQNLAGGETADDAEKTFADQKEVLAEQHIENLRAAQPQAQSVTVEGDTAKPAEGGTSTKAAPAKSTAKTTDK